ncbi:MAG TPA: protein-L-isoaspartate O-methyltransferase [Sphingomicrobium sp.]|nr:protein-L-isoaspartate O-methyltransferase [Sphingomicrobium sp.]
MTIQLPVPDYAAARQAMIDSQLRPEGVNDPLVIDAMARVPREQFVPEHNRQLAYSDRSVPIGDGRELAPPVATGLLLTAMALRPGQRALVIGSGSGYSAAVLSAIGLEVTAVEGSAELRALAEAQGVRTTSAKPEEGFAEAGPFDVILIDGAIEHVPDSIVAQLKDGGTIGFASLDRGVSRLTVGRKAGGALGLRTIADSAVPPLPGFTRPRAFTF